MKSGRFMRNLKLLLTTFPAGECMDIIQLLLFPVFITASYETEKNGGPRITKLPLRFDSYDSR